MSAASTTRTASPSPRRSAGGFEASLDVVASGAGLLNAWIDFNADGDWTDAGEQVFTDQALVAGVNALSISVPAGAIVGDTFSRFRFDTLGGLSFTGLASDGEIEDHMIEIEPSRDLELSIGDTPDPVPEGGRLVYHLSVWTNGQLDSSSVELTYTLPAETTFVTASHGGCSETGGIVTCDLGTVTPGSAIHFEIEVDVDFGTTGTISATATVTSPDGDLFPGNNTEMETTTGRRRADLHLLRRVRNRRYDSLVRDLAIAFGFDRDRRRPPSTSVEIVPSSAVAKGPQMIRKLTLLVAVIAITAGAPSDCLAQLEPVDINLAGTATGNQQARNLDEDEVPGAISPDGRYVGYWSSSTDLIPNDTNGAEIDIFVRDRVAGENLLVSVNAAGDGSGNGESGEPAMMSGNGRCVVFASTADDLDPLDTNTDRDVFVRDFVTGNTTLVSINLAGTGSGNGESFSAWIDHTCSLVAFRSAATNLSADTDGDTLADVYLRDLALGTTILVSKNAAGDDSANATVDGLFMVGDGSYLLFQSEADNLVPGLIDSNGLYDIFFYDVSTGFVEAISIEPTGTSTANGQSFGGVLSADGECVAFRSLASDLTALPTNGHQQVYLRDRISGSTQVVSIAASGTSSGDGQSYAPRIGADCRFVTFVSQATDLTGANAQGQTQVYRRNTATGATDLVSVNAGDTNGGNDTSDGAVMSPFGNWIAFESNATDLVATATDGRENIYLRNMSSGRTVLVSVNATGTASGDGNSEDVAFSGNGKYLIFESSASDLTSIPDGGSGKSVIFRVNWLFADGFDSGDLSAWSSSTP